MSEELRHLPRHEKKHLVKGWAKNASATIQCNSTDKAHTIAEPESVQKFHHDDEEQELADIDANNDALMQWLRQESSASSVVSSQWDSHFANSPNLFRDQEQQEEGSIPLTSGQVKYAYRTRARREEIEQNKKALALKLQRDKLLALYKKPSAKQNTTQKAIVQYINSSKNAIPAANSVEPPERTGGGSSVDDDHVDEDPDVHHLSLPAARQLCTDPVFRDDMLREIRKQLVAGRDVLLTSKVVEVTTTEEQEAVSVRDVTLLMQQLCSQNLMYCVHNQEIVPQVKTAQQNYSSQRVSLWLRSRIRAATLK